MHILTNAGRKEKIARITALFRQLYCFTSAEIDDFLEKTAAFPDEGLDKMIASLEDGLKQQNNLIADRINQDKDYVKDLGRFLNKTAVSLKAKWERSESEKAEDILVEI